MTAGARDLTGVVVSGRYKVERLLGVGGMGSVWLVQHQGSLQRFALKVLNGDVDQESVERFLREARAAAALRSKHVVKVVDADMEHVDPATGARMPYVAMELLDGAPLDALLAERGRLAPAELVWILAGVARALDAAHAQGIVHRDLKPENVFVAFDEDEKPVVKVCDFGIAKLAGASAGDLLPAHASKTAAGAALGTPLYMSPEQVHDAASVTPASDQWPVALIAYRALTGREYFGEAQNLGELVLRIVQRPMPPPSSLARDAKLPSHFDEWFARSCDRDPLRRWPSVGEQVDALSRALVVTVPAAPRIDRRASLRVPSAVPPSLGEGPTLDLASLQPPPMAPAPQATSSAPASRRFALFAAVAIGAVAAASFVALRLRDSDATGNPSKAKTALGKPADPGSEEPQLPRLSIDPDPVESASAKPQSPPKPAKPIVVPAASSSAPAPPKCRHPVMNPPYARDPGLPCVASIECKSKHCGKKFGTDCEGVCL